MIIINTTPGGMQTFYGKVSIMNKSRVGVNTVLIGPPDEEACYVKDSLLHLLEQYTRYSDLIGALEFSHVVNITPEDGVEIGRHARESGFRTWSIHSEHLNTGGKLEDYLALQKHEAEVCAALGCEVMVCHLPNLRPYVDFERDLNVIGKVAELTRACGVKLAVETCFYPDANGDMLLDADLVIRVVEALNLDDVGINVDTGHCFFGQTRCREERLKRILSGEEEQDLPRLIRRIGKKLFTTHLHDNFGMHDDHQAPGMGCINWEQVVPAILETGYQGPLMMELTGMGCKAGREVPQMRKFPLEKEIVSAASYLNFLLKESTTIQ